MIRWTSLRFPAFSSERWLRATERPERVALAAVARDGGRERVVDASPRAVAAGVRRGMSAPAARAACAELVVVPVDAAAERRTLEGLAASLFRFTPDVRLDGPHALLLETGRTAARFGGEIALLRLVRTAVETAGFSAAIGVAGPPGTARCLARGAAAGETLRAGDSPRRAVAPLPWSCLEPDAAAAEVCRALGLRTIGDLEALPRAALPSRFGAPFVAALAAATGDAPEVGRRFEPPVGFAERAELWTPIEDTAPLLFAASRLFAAAEAALEARERGATEARLRLVFVGGEAAIVPLRPSRPSRRPATFVRLLQHRLEAAPAGAPVEALELYIPPEAWAPLATEEPGLFSPTEADDADAAELADRLAARLGAARVATISLTADHRPERAYRWRPHGARASEPSAPPPCGPRPLELFVAPEPLDVAADADGAPYGYVDEAGRREPLRVVRGPERVAAGWWDGADVDRAYFEVETRAGLRWWLYRDQADGSWRRHGAFS